jgi:aminopeptidase-like protein
MSDGDNDLLDVAERSGIAFGAVVTAAAALQDAGLLKEVSG